MSDNNNGATYLPLDVAQHDNNCNCIACKLKHQYDELVRSGQIRTVEEVRREQSSEIKRIKKGN